MNTQSTADIALVGFNDHDRLVMNSLFRISGAYREWQQDEKSQPDCILVDVDEEIGRVSEDRELTHPSGAPIVAVGAQAPGKSIVAHIKRPFRWADILYTLDSVIKAEPHPFRTGTDAPSTSSAPAVRSSVRRAFAVTARSNGVKVFKTVPAVLVVNPKPTGWRHITAQIASLGYRVDHVSTGAAAVTLLTNFRYNCVILETQLPDQDGFEICKLLKKIQGRRRIASIILTTSKNPTDRIRSKLVGCDAFISKPVDPEDLRKTLKAFMPEYVLEE